MIKRRYTGAKPKTILPEGTVDTQLHLYMPGFPAQPGGPALPDGLPGPAEYRQVIDWLGIDRLGVTQGNAHQKDNGNTCAILGEMGGATPGAAQINPTFEMSQIPKQSTARKSPARATSLAGRAQWRVGLQKTAVPERTRMIATAFGIVLG